MDVRYAQGKTIMDRLIAKLPDAAMVNVSVVIHTVASVVPLHCAV